MSQYALPELDAMQQIADIIRDLTPSERRRVAAWLMEYAPQWDTPSAAEHALEESEPETAPVTLADESKSLEEPDQKEFATFAELYACVAPRKGAQKASNKVAPSNSLKASKSLFLKVMTLTKL